MTETLNQAKTFGIDTETTGLFWWKDSLVAVSLATEDGQTWVVTGEWLRPLRAWLHAVLLNPTFTLIGHNLKFDLHFLVSWLEEGLPHSGFIPQCVFIDTSIALFLLNENEDNDLKSSVWRIFRHRMATFKQTVGTTTEETGESRTRKCQACRCAKSKLADCDVCKGTGVETVAKTRTRMRMIDEVPVEEWDEYAGEDAYYPLHIWKWARVRLSANESLERNFIEVQMPLMLTLYSIEHKGVRIDLAKVRELKNTYLSDLELVQHKLDKLVTGVNFNSPAQLHELFYDKLKLPTPPFRPSRKDSKGNRVTSKYRTDEACLIWLAQEQGCEIATHLLEHRRLSKLLSVYITGIEENVVGDILYPHFNQTVARTGRLSSSDPVNLQNIPLGPEIHQVFIARPGCKLIVADLAQAELRVLAHYSRDEALMRVYLEEGRDLHQETADEIGISKYVPAQEARTSAKRANFGIAYGIWGQTFRRTVFVDTKGAINIPLDDANAIVTSVNARYPGVTRWKKGALSEIRAKGYAETLDGRRRRLPGVRSSNWGLKSYAERQGINVYIQGGVADIINRIMNEWRDAWPFTLLLQVHDEIVFEVPNDQVERAAADVKRIAESMTQRFNLSVPLVCEPKAGTTWAVK